MIIRQWLQTRTGCTGFREHLSRGGRIRAQLLRTRMCGTRMSSGLLSTQYTQSGGGGLSPPGPPGPPSPGVSAVGDEKVMVRFLEDYDKPFTGVDLREYGPFEEGDILRMPKANAEILESWGVVRWFGSGPDD